MRLLDWLLGRRTQTASRQDQTVAPSGSTPASGESARHLESHNRGTRHDTLELAESYWTARLLGAKHEPFVLYTFDDERAARAALLDLPCIHLAEDSGSLICTEVLVFGCYATEQGKYEAIVCGDLLTPELWQAARDAFVNHGGSRKNEQEPDQRASPNAGLGAGDPQKVVFVREDRRPGAIGGTYVYRIHRAPDAASALAFLELHPITRELYYLVVETPEGNYARDIGGIYKE